MTEPGLDAARLKEIEERFDPEMRFRPLPRLLAGATGAVFFALSNFLTLSPGTNRNDRMTSRLWFAVHQPRSPATGNHLATLIGGGVLELDDALGRPRFAGAF